MFFCSFEYLWFLAGSLLLFYLLPFQLRRYFIALISLICAFLWGWQTGVVLLIQSLAAFLLAQYVERTQEERKRKAGVALSILFLLGILGFFKYANFFIGSAIACGKMLHLDIPEHHLAVLLPVGISFYTFICLGYMIDVYRRKCAAEKNLFSFLCFSAFFPQFASGPIGRAPELLKQFHEERHCVPENLEIGFRLILWGLFKKVVIADRLAMIVDPVFSHPGNYSGITLLIVMYLFTIQIYCDFSGYSDIAIGSAELFGIRLMRNFNLPYFADSIYEFWKRWHISLTGWFRDYLYIPLGGNRVSTLRWLFNIMAVFLVSGLWHGAAWTFVIWGGIHGIVYLVELGIRKHLAPESFWFSPGMKPVRILLTFHIVAVAWIFFRASSIESAWQFLAGIFCNSGDFYWGVSKIPRIIAFVLTGFLGGVELLTALKWNGDYLFRGKCPSWGRILGYSVLLMGIALLGIRSNTFIYLQF